MFRNCKQVLSVKNGPSIPDTLGSERTVLIIEVSSFQGLKEQSIVNHLVPVTCVLHKHKRGVCNSGSGLEGCLQFRDLD